MDGTRPILATDIVGYLSQKRIATGFELSVTEFCPYHSNRRIDAYYFNIYNREAKGFEIKISRSDFLADKKWSEYLRYCNYFYFITAENVVRPDELPENIGLIEMSWKTREIFNYLSDEKEPQYYLSHELIKKAKRIGNISEDDYIVIIQGLLYKVIYDRNLIKVS